MKKYWVTILLLWITASCNLVTKKASSIKEGFQSQGMDVIATIQQDTNKCSISDNPPKTELELHMEELGFVDIETVAADIKVSLMYASDDNFTGKVMYHNLSKAYLHSEAAEALINAQAELKRIRPDLSLKVYDAARPLSVQQTMWDYVKGTSNQIYVSNPANGGGLHNYGLAVDVTLCYAATGDTLSMGTHIDYFGRMAQVRYEKECLEENLLKQEAYENRLLLRKVMTTAGYKVLPTEWWHFNFKTRAEAKAHYKLIK